MTTEIRTPLADLIDPQVAILARRSDLHMIAAALRGEVAETEIDSRDREELARRIDRELYGEDWDR